MKLIKGGFFVFGGLFLMVTLISLLMPSKIMTAKAVTIKADSIKLFDAVSNLNNWKMWHPVFIEDTSTVALSNPSSGINSYITWKTNGKVNKLIVTKIAYPEAEFILKRDGEKDLEYAMYINREEGGNMQLQWKAVTSLRWYPWEKFGGIFIEKLSGAGYESALTSLKQYVEKQN